MTYDEENFLEDVLALFQAKMPAKIADINAEKNDGIVLDDIPSARYVENLDDEILNYEKFIFYGVGDITPISIRSATALDVELFFDLIFVDDQGSRSKTIRKKIQRYTRAMREIINDNFRTLRYTSDIMVDSMSPTNLSNKEGTVFFKVAGVQIKGTIG